MTAAYQQESETPIWVEGIGPPLQQIEQDFRELVDSTCGGIAQDGLKLTAEIRRLRAELDAIYRDAANSTVLGRISRRARRALDKS